MPSVTQSALVSRCLGLPGRSRRAWREPNRRELREELAVHLGDIVAEPVLRKTDHDDGLDLTVWVCSSWTGPVENCEPEEHDAIGWFGVAELGGLEFADRSYLSMLQRVLGTA